MIMRTFTSIVSIYITPTVTPFLTSILVAIITSLLLISWLCLNATFLSMLMILVVFAITLKHFLFMETVDFQSLPPDILSAAEAERLATQYRPVVCFDDFFLVEYGYKYYDSRLDCEVSYPCLRYFFNKDPKQPTLLHSVFFGPITDFELAKLKQSFAVYSRMSC